MATATVEFFEDLPQPVGQKIPDYLVRERFSGMEFYYPGFREIMNKTKKIEDTMADSSLQWILKGLIADFLKSKLDQNLYFIGQGEIGLHLAKYENVGLDVAVFDHEKLFASKISGKYTQVPPILVIEIDINIEMLDKTSNPFDEYAMAKIDRLLNFGVERFLWIFSKSKTVFVAEKNQNWYFTSWDKKVEMMNGIELSVSELLKSKGIILDK